MVFHTDKGSPGPPGFFYIPVNRKARAQTYGADMPHQPPPPGLPRKVDGHKKSRLYLVSNSDVRVFKYLGWFYFRKRFACFRALDFF